MKSKRNAARRERRDFSAEFKAEAVRLVAERRARGDTLAQVGRELDVKPDQLRQRGPNSNSVTAELGQGGRWSRWSRRCVGCGAKWPCCAKSKRSQKKWRCTSQRSRVEVRRDHSPSGRVPSATHVPGS